MADIGLDGEYDPENIFAMIISGVFQCHKVYEDDVAMAFMDVFPQSPGHVLVVPKTRARNFLDFPTEELGPFMARVQKISHAVRKALNPDGISMFQFSGGAGGQSVFHLHFHIIPRTEGIPLHGHGTMQRADDAELADFAKRIASAI